MNHEQFFVDGRWVTPHGKERADVVDAATEEVMGSIPLGNAQDVDDAVAAAKRAFGVWAATPVEDRAGYLQRLSQALAARADEIGDVISREVGMPRKLAKPIQAGLPIAVMGSYARILRETELETEMGRSLVVREPVGVVGAITPWNYPLHQVVGKVAPALAAGCTVVLKPSEVAPLSAWILAEVIEELGLPPGVFNLVGGDGPTVGEALVSHPDVDMVSFTGSTRAGRRVGELAAATVKRVTLELGGKSPNVILEDADLDKAVRRGVGACFINNGQTCSALTRMLVPEDRLADAEAILVDEVAKWVVGDPADAATRLGPLVSAAQRDRVRAYIEKGIEEGARVVVGGPTPPLSRGYFVRPTVFADVTPDMTIAREEIFGPVLCLMGCRDDEDASRLANDTPYGLSAAVWSKDLERARRVARRIRAGQVDINGGSFNHNAPFGGMKQSGNGRELGPFGLEEYFELKSVQI